MFGKVEIPGGSIMTLQKSEEAKTRWFRRCGAGQRSSHSADVLGAFDCSMNLDVNSRSCADLTCGITSLIKCAALQVYSVVIQEL